VGHGVGRTVLGDQRGQGSGGLETRIDVNRSNFRNPAILMLSLGPEREIRDSGRVPHWTDRRTDGGFGARDRWDHFRGEKCSLEFLGTKRMHKVITITGWVCVPFSEKLMSFFEKNLNMGAKHGRKYFLLLGEW